MRDRLTIVKHVALLSLHSSPIAPLGRSDAGGMNLYVRRLADELAALGLQVDLFTRRTDTRLPAVVELGPKTRLIHLDAGLPQLEPKARLPRLIPTMAHGLQTFARNESIDYDVLHCHYWISGLVGLRCRESLGAPVVSMFHTLSKVKAQYAGSGAGVDSGLRTDGERDVLANSDAIVGATELERTQLTRLYGRAPLEFAVIPPGVDATTFRSQSTDASRRELGIEAEKVILFVGRLDPMKRLDLLLRAISLLPRAQREGLRVVVVGGNDEQDRIAAKHYHSIAADLGLEGIVELRSNVPQDQLALYYSSATVCAVPSAYESFGMVALESMACETPVVAFDVGGIATTVQNGSTGFLARPGNTMDFSQKLAEALESDSLEIMGRRARESTRPYRWSRIGRLTMSFYEDVTSVYEDRSLELAGAG
jgi:D-inositol-3-phosphate glycosyltransferase